MIVFLAKRVPLSIKSGNHLIYEKDIQNDFVNYGYKGVLPYKEFYARIYYFHSERTSIDVDNFSKPILDALKGRAYPDDRLILLRTSAKIRTSSIGIQELDIKNIDDRVLEDLLDSWDTEKHIIYIEIGKFSIEMLTFEEKANGTL